MSFILGMIIGAIFSIMVMSLCIAAKNRDKQAEKLYKERTNKKEEL